MARAILKIRKVSLQGDQPQEKPARKYPNPTLRLLTERASCRDFAAKKIPPRVLQHVLEAGVHAPTGGNLQPYSIIKIEKEATRKKLAERCGQPFIARAPVNLLFCIDFHRIERWAGLETAPFTATSSFRHFWIGFQDTIICAQNICTAADSLGLGSVYIGTVLEFIPKVRTMLRLPKGVFPVVLLCLGYPKTRPEPRRKLDAEVVVHNERYRELSDRKLLAAYNAKHAGIHVEIIEQRLRRIERVCRKAHGAGFARECLGRIKKNGCISMAQFYFGLHYVADVMPRGNQRFLELMEKCGFGWFQRYRPRR
jgi:FMN reductase [NAD(P)H]